VSARVEAFRQGLRELGYVEGENLVIEWRYSEGKLDRLRELASELVHLKVDVIVSAGPEPTRSAKEAVATMPIVMTQDPDPIGNGFAASLARPGGNITGLSTFHTELSGKRLELLKETVPRLSRVAVFGDSGFPGNAGARKETDLVAGALKVTLQHLDVRNHKDIEALFRAAINGRADAALGVGGAVLNAQRAWVVKLAAKSRLPMIYGIRESVEDGG
jgi:putative ABC transport system substrate-binding protein